MWVCVGCLWLQMEPMVAKSPHPIASCFSAFPNQSGMDGEAVPILAPVSIWPKLLRGLGGQKEKLTTIIIKASEIPGHHELQETQEGKKKWGRLQTFAVPGAPARNAAKLILPQSHGRALHDQLNSVWNEGQGVAQPSLSLWKGGCCR